MNLIAETDGYKIYWYDEDKTILVSEVYAGWTWTTAYEGLKHLNQILGQRASELTVYSILEFKSGAQLLPKSGSIISNLRNLLKDDPQHEAMTVYVLQVGFLHNMMQMVNKLYDLRHWIDKHRFVTSIDDALRLIEEHKQTSLSDD